VNPQWTGWQAVIRWRFWPRMAERCADQEDLEHAILQLEGCRWPALPGTYQAWPLVPEQPRDSPAIKSNK